MHISAISSNANLHHIGSIHKNSQQRQNYFEQLSQALQSGDMSAAQQAFATLQQDMQSVQIGHQHHHHYMAELSNLSLDDANNSNAQPVGILINVTT
jgi:hypothetical protein